MATVLAKMYCYSYLAYCFLFEEWWDADPKEILTDDRFETVFEGEWKS